MAEALVYEREVVDALESIIDPHMRLIDYRTRSKASADLRLYQPDAVVDVDGRSVFVEVKRPSSPERLRSMIIDHMEGFNSEGDTAKPLFVSPYPSPLDSKEEEELRVVVVQWNGPEDTESLQAALRRASALGESS